MSGQRLDIGEHGDVHYRDKPNGRVAASVYFRNAQGVRKRIEATDDSRASARRRLFATLGEAMAAGRAGLFAALYVCRCRSRLAGVVRRAGGSGSTFPANRGALPPCADAPVLPGLGGLRLSELTAARMDRFIRDRRRAARYSVAKLCRSVTSGTCAFAVRRDAMRHNPVRDVEALERPSTQEARALTDEECRAWLMILDGSELARQADLPELVHFLLETGCRIGEALALTLRSTLP